MKGIIRLLFWVVALTTFCGTVSAQTGKQRLTREQLAEVQAKHIAKEMAMDDATSQRFIDTFCQFQRDIWALGPTGHLGTRSASETAAQPNDR